MNSMKTIYVAPKKELQGDTAYTAANTRWTPSLFDKCTGFLYMRYTQHMGPTALRS